ncbi:CTP synthase, partial [Candidatus Berkelbacteria bacterium]|nr:CTP synthase [Candidatus Berkelbacteria bacterium]
MKTKYIFVTGGIVSGIGKGTTVASLGRLFLSRGKEVALVKIDPYLNRDAGTMNPFQHGEVFVTEDGTETDLDLGHYERFLNKNLNRLSNFTTGTVYETVTKRERQGAFLGKTIQIIPHITDEIKRRIREAGQPNKADLVICEIGGTIGDIEGLPFLEAIRQMKKDVGAENVAYIHVVKIDYIYPSGEAKTKPIQHSVQALRGLGIQPDILVTRCRKNIPPEIKEKITLFCGIGVEDVIEAPNMSSIYAIPLALETNGLGKAVEKILGLPTRQPKLKDWSSMINKLKKPQGEVTIALIGKYLDHPDAYISVVEALHHGGIANQVKIKLKAVDSEKIKEGNLSKFFQNVNGVVVPGGFGIRGIEGKVRAIQYARENKIPFLGLCLGLQTAVIEYARHKIGLKGANSTEFDAATPHPVIDILPEQKKVRKMGGTMRLGSYSAHLKPHSLIANLYQNELISERHRHRFEVNPYYHKILNQNGLIFSGTSKDGLLVE